MEHLSVLLFWVGTALTGSAALFHLGAAFGSRVVQRAAATNAGTVTLTERQPPAVSAAAALVAMLVTRTIATGHPPYSNMFEFLSAFGAGVVIAAQVFERR